MYGLEGQVAFVTGAALGIGRAVALLLAREGCRVGLFDRIASDATADAVRAAGGTVAVATGNVADRADVTRAFAAFERELGAPHILVNNAGILRAAPVVELTDQAWNDTLSVNVGGVFLCCQAVLPGMLARRSGTIVNMASFAGKKGQATLAAYCASKFAVIGFTQSLALEVAAQGIRVNAVCPGIIVNTGMRDEIEQYNAAHGRPAADERAKMVPMQRAGEPEDVARVVAFLASAEAGYMTGQAINVTGGLLDHMIPRTLFGPEHELFRDQVRRFIATEITPHHGDWEKAGIVPRSLWLKAGEAGLLCTQVPEEYGGAGGDFLFGAITIEEMARAGATGPTFYLHSDIVAPYIVHYGTEEQKRRWLPPMARGEVIVALGMSEPSGGSDVAGMRTTARHEGEEWVINGQKVFITAGFNADLVVLACKTDPKAGARGISLILVETDRPGFARGRRLEKIGCKAQDTAELFFADCRVPASNLLGEENRGFHQLMKELSQERLVQAVRAVASAEAALEWTVDYAQQRKMFGQTLADFQNTQFKLAEMQAEIAMQRVFVDRCIELHLRGALDAVDAAKCKLVSTEMQFRVMDQCLQFFGGWGYMWEFPIARAFVDARLGRIGGGSVEVMKQIIARDMMPGNRRNAR